MSNKDTFGIVTLIMGIVALIGCWIPFINIISMIIAISGIIVGICSIVKFLKKKCRNCALAIIGMILSIITIYIGININNKVSDNFSSSSVFKTGDTKKQANKSVKNSKETNTNNIENKSEESSSNVTLSQKNALKKAKSYLDYSSFSRSGLIKQLEFEKFSLEDATYAVDNCGANWNEQAIKKAKSYLDYSSFSAQGLIDQLKFEGFTQKEAEYAIKSIGL